MKKLGEELAAIYQKFEPKRHKAEVLHLIELRKISVERKEAYLDKVERARGKEAADKLARDAAELWMQQKARK